jgi:beta-hydroxyacyl-ACP dehydratase FabZ
VNPAEILATLPHRYPFLLVDRVDELDADHILAVKAVSFNEPHFQGHFPGAPVMPGVLILEALAQAGGILAITALQQTPGFDPAKKLLYFMGIDGAKFRRQVVPGDLLRLHVVPLRKGSAVWKMKGQAFVGEQLAAEAVFLATIADR